MKCTELLMCPHRIIFGDDYGANETTFHCQLKVGHRGKHLDKGQQGRQPYWLRWGKIEKGKKDENIR